MSSRFGPVGKDQRGFTLNELVISIAILGMITPVIGMSIFQVISISKLSGNHMMAVTQVENAVHWINHDAQMAQSVQTSNGSGFPLKLTWVEWNNTSNNVTYSVQNGQLWRAYSVNSTQPTSTLVARNIKTDSQSTNCQFSSGALNFQITVSSGGYKSASETRNGKVIPKPM